MSVQASIWDKLTKVVVFLLFMAGLIGLFFWYLPLIKHNQNFRQAILELDKEIQEQEQLSRQLRASIEAVQNDPRTIERLARERLGYARPDELVVRFEGGEGR